MKLITLPLYLVATLLAFVGGVMVVIAILIAALAGNLRRLEWKGKR